MSTLSPTTQTVYDAFNRIGLYNEPSFETDRKALAAAIRAIAKELSYGHGSDPVGDPIIDEGDLLTIADELDEVEPFDEEENDRRFQECMDMINNLQPGDITKLMGEEFMEEFRRVSQ
jgi:hypothetical protein